MLFTSVKNLHHIIKLPVIYCFLSTGSPSYQRHYFSEIISFEQRWKF